MGVDSGEDPVGAVLTADCGRRGPRSDEGMAGAAGAFIDMVDDATGICTEERTRVEGTVAAAVCCEEAGARGTNGVTSG
jgi:hypothetical protein